MKFHVSNSLPIDHNFLRYRIPGETVTFGGHLFVKWSRSSLQSKHPVTTHLSKYEVTLTGHVLARVEACVVSQLRPCVMAVMVAVRIVDRSTCSSFFRMGH